MLIEIAKVALFVTAVSAVAFSLPQSQDGILFTSAPYNLSSSESRLLHSINGSGNTATMAPLLNATIPRLPPLSDDVSIRCSYGRELRMDDCIDALNTFVYPPDRNLSIAQRAKRPQRWDLKLPVRWISGKLTFVWYKLLIEQSWLGNGYCTFDIIKHGRQTTSLATGMELMQAGLALVNQCVETRSGQGGIATNIGMHDPYGLTTGRSRHSSLS